MASATRKKPAQTGNQSPARKSSAKSSTKPKPAATEEAKLIEAIRDKRASYDQPVVDTPVPVLDIDPEVEGLDGTVHFEADGQTVKVSVGGKTVTLDREGVLAAQRAFSKAGAAF